MRRQLGKFASRIRFRLQHLNHQGKTPLRQIAKVLAVLFAAAQPATLPANTVFYGRQATPSGGGPGQVIPLAKLFANPGIAAGPQSWLGAQLV